MNNLSSSAGLRGLIYQMDRLDTIADNLANVGMPGFKKTVSTQAAFDAMVRSGGGHGAFGHSGAALRAVDFTPGALTVTDNPLDFAINGQGFFVVQKDGRECYTRNGRFEIGSDGSVRTSGGWVVQGRDGPLVVPPDTDMAQLTVDADGSVRSGERAIGSVRVVSFETPAALSRVGTTMFSAPAAMEPAPATDSRVVNRAVEGGNATAIEEMAELIGATRSFEICQRMLKQMDQTQGATIQQLSA